MKYIKLIKFSWIIYAKTTKTTITTLKVTASTSIVVTFTGI